MELLLKLDDLKGNTNITETLGWDQINGLLIQKDSSQDELFSCISRVCAIDPLRPQQSAKP
jgi:hypothetical protein